MNEPIQVYEVLKVCRRCGRAGPGKSFLEPTDGQPVKVRTCTKCSDEVGRELKSLTGPRKIEPTADDDQPRRFGR